MYLFSKNNPQFNSLVLTSKGNESRSASCFANFHCLVILRVLQWDIVKQKKDIGTIDDNSISIFFKLKTLHFISNSDTCNIVIAKSVSFHLVCFYGTSIIP